MPLLRNTNQPFYLDPNSPNRIDCFGEFCYPVQEGDLIRQQWYQTPCGNDLLEDPNFEDVTLGAELLTDTTFPSPSPSWVSAPGGAWTPSGGVNSVAVYDATFPGGTYTQGPIVITPGDVYQLTITVGGLATGDYMNVYVGSATPTLIISTNGTAQTFNLIAGSDNTNIVLEAVSSSNFTIDNISLKSYTLNTWDTNGNWQTDDGSACKLIDGTGVLEESVADYIEADGYYQLTFTISGWNGLGTIVPMVSDASPSFGDTVTGNGTYTFYFEPTITGVVSFVPSNTWQGCVSIPDEDTDEFFTGLRQLRNDYIFEFIGPNMQDGDVNDMSLFATYYRDKITLAYDPLAEELNHGCYIMRAYDACLVIGNDLIENGSFADGSTGWTTGSGNISYAGSQATVTFDPLTGGSNIITNGDFSGGSTGWTATGWTIAAGVATHNIGNTNSLTQSVVITTPATPPAFKLWWFVIQMANRTAGSIDVELDDASQGGYSENGIWTWTLAPTNGGTVDFKITPTTDFDGDITGIILIEQVIPHVAGGTFYNTPNPAIVAGNYQMSFEITNIVDTFSSGVIAAAGGIVAMAQATVFENTVAVHTVSIPNYVPGTQIPFLTTTFGEIDAAGGIRAYIGSISLDNVELVGVEPFEATYTSECLNYQELHPNTKLITGYADQEAFNLEFTNTGFRLQFRVAQKSMNPFSVKDKTLARFGTGDAALAYASNEKWWVFVTDLMDESAHDALSAIVDMDHFLIGQTEDTSIEYVAEVEDYTPQWRAEGDYSMAAIQINLRKKTGGMLFNRHT